MGKWTQGSGLSSSPTSFLGVIVLHLPGLCIAVLPPAQGPTGECQGHSHASHQAFSSWTCYGKPALGLPYIQYLEIRTHSPSAIESPAMRPRRWWPRLRGM